MIRVVCPLCQSAHVTVRVVTEQILVARCESCAAHFTLSDPHGRLVSDDPDATIALMVTDTSTAN